MRLAGLPRDGAPYPAEAAWRYPLAAPIRARHIRLLFPDGGQAGAKYPGYLCLGEVEAVAPELAPRLVAVDGRFATSEPRPSGSGSPRALAAP
jgi:hypothetical protein